MNRRRLYEIGDPDGRIALCLNRQGALDLAATFGPRDTAYEELMLAVRHAYPESEDCDDE